MVCFLSIHVIRQGSCKVTKIPDGAISSSVHSREPRIEAKYADGCRCTDDIVLLYARVGDKYVCRGSGDREFTLWKVTCVVAVVEMALSMQNVPFRRDQLRHGT